MSSVGSLLQSMHSIHRRSCAILRRQVPCREETKYAHPGIDPTYFISGGGELLVDGQPPKPFKAGEAVQVPPGAIHSVKNGPAVTKGIGTYVVEKGKPLASPA